MDIGVGIVAAYFISKNLFKKTGLGIANVDDPQYSGGYDDNIEGVKLTKEQVALLADNDTRRMIRQKFNHAGARGYITKLKAKIIDLGEDPVIDVVSGTGNLAVDEALLERQLRSLAERTAVGRMRPARPELADVTNIFGASAGMILSNFDDITRARHPTKPNEGGDD